jgi:AcrR family transcriptional regulator
MGYLAMPKIVDHEQQRRELSSTVASTLAQLGLENTTLRAVAANHGCTKGMVQHYFADKEELLLGALSSVEEQCEARLTRTSVKHKGLARLHARLAALLPTSPLVVDEWKVRFSFNARAALSQEMHDCLSHSHARHQRAGMSCLRQAQKAGDLRPGLNLRNSYRCLLALVSGLSLSVVVGGEGLSSSTQRQILKTAIENLRH